jgi:hypothetical protein
MYRVCRTRPTKNSVFNFESSKESDGFRAIAASNHLSGDADVEL